MIEKLRKRLEFNLGKRDKNFDANKLRKTIITDFKCDFVEFKSNGNEKKPAMDDVTGIRFKRLVADLIANPEDQDVRDKMVNLRAQIWKIVCRVGDL